MKTFKFCFLITCLIMIQQFTKAQGVYSKQDVKTGLYGFVDADDKYVVKPIYKEVDFNFGNTTGLSKVINTCLLYTSPSPRD